MPKIVVIGGGISGLAVAWYLSMEGHEVDVYEAEDTLGGNCRAVPLGQNWVDIYYHVVSTNSSPMRDLIASLGLDSDLYPVRTSMAFNHEGKLYPVSGIVDYLKFAPLTTWNKFQLIICLLRSLLVKKWQYLDGELARDWLISIGGKEIYNKIWRPVMHAKFGNKTDEIVATDMWYRLNRMWFTTLGRKNQGPFYIKGTMKYFFDRFEEGLIKLGASVHKQNPVSLIETNDNHVKGVVLASGVSVACEHVVGAIPLPRLVSIMPSQKVPFKDETRQIQFLNNICLILKTERPISQYYQVAFSDPTSPFTGIISGEQFYPPEEYGGYVTYLTRYFMGQEELFNVSSKQLLEEYLPYIRKVKSDFKLNEVIDLQIVKGHDVEPLHTLHYSKMLPPILTSLPGLSLLNQAHIYPEPTVLDVSVSYAKKAAKLISSTLS